MIRLHMLAIILSSGVLVTKSWVSPSTSSSLLLQQKQPKRRQTTSLASMSELDAELGFLPKEVMSKFLSSVGGPIAYMSLEAGYQAGAVTDEELEDVEANLPDMLSSELSSPQLIDEKWKEALADQPWHIKTMGNLASGAVVSIVANLQIKMKDQATQMKWINENALHIIEANSEVVDILGGSPLRFNNTRAMYESDRDGNIWSASMDVMGASVEKSDSNDNGKTGLVNAYFTPSDDIKILVVEIDDYMHNLTWKGLP